MKIHCSLKISCADVNTFLNHLSTTLTQTQKSVDNALASWEETLGGFFSIHISFFLNPNLTLNQISYFSKCLCSSVSPTRLLFQPFSIFLGLLLILFSLSFLCWTLFSSSVSVSFLTAFRRDLGQRWSAMLPPGWLDTSLSVWRMKFPKLLVNFRVSGGGGNLALNQTHI